MEIISAQLGTFEVDDQSIYCFESGLYGLEEYTKYALVRPDTDLPFAYLQSIEDTQICLLLADPFAFDSSYEFDLSEQDVTRVGSPSIENVSVWVTISMKNSFEDATANFMAPIVMNKEKKIAIQSVLHDSSYKTRTPLFPQEKGEK